MKQWWLQDMNYVEKRLKAPDFKKRCERWIQSNGGWEALLQYATYGTCNKRGSSCSDARRTVCKVVWLASLSSLLSCVQSRAKVAESWRVLQLS